MNPSLSASNRSPPVCPCCPAPTLQQRAQTCWQMLAGPSLIYLMAPMRRSRQSWLWSLEVVETVRWSQLERVQIPSSELQLAVSAALFQIWTHGATALVVSRLAWCWPSTDQIALLYRHNDNKVASPALKAVGNIVHWDDSDPGKEEEESCLWTIPPAVDFSPGGGQCDLGEKAQAWRKNSNSATFCDLWATWLPLFFL